MLMRGLGRGVVVLAAGLAASTTHAAPTAQSAPRTRIDLRVFRFVDTTRVAVFRNGARSSRTLVTYVRYPTTGRGPFPLIVFAHGFGLVPADYSRLLDAWARAGYVVAAPVFPVENANAPGGPDESDLSNEPRDVSFVISRLLAADADATSPLHGLIDRARVAVAGHSDGGEAAFAVAYEREFVDPRIRAAVILSGAPLSPDSLARGRRSPPLLAVQGTADRINAPTFASLLFGMVARPKFLLSLLGAGHLPPYSSDQHELAVVERVSIAFLDHYLERGTLRRLLDAGHAPGLARLTAVP